MKSSTYRLTPVVLAFGLVSGAAQAALQGRDLDGNLSTFEAYYDTVLDITWLKDANYARTSHYPLANGGSYDGGYMDWSTATTWAANLSFTDGVNVYDDWRLPSFEPGGASYNYGVSYNGSTDVGYNITSPKSELSYMYYVNLANLSLYTPTGALSGCASVPDYSCLDNTGPFINLPTSDSGDNDHYWYGTVYGPSLGLRSLFFFHEGLQIYDSESREYKAWAVSDGDVGLAPVPEADTWAMLLAGLGVVGMAVRRKARA